MSKKKFFPAEREGTIKGKRAKEQRAIQESWGGKLHKIYCGTAAYDINRSMYLNNI